MQDQTNTINYSFPTGPSAVEVWLTRSDRSALFQKQEENLRFVDARSDAFTIQVDATQAFQTMDGFGFALTGGSALLISRLPTLIRNALLRELFSTEAVSYTHLTLPTNREV